MNPGMFRGSSAAAPATTRTASLTSGLVATPRHTIYRARMTMLSFRVDDDEATQAPTRHETAIADIADWGPAEDWSDWADATR
jgi:hypothetical protein